MSFGDNLKTIRTNAGMTRVELAEKLGISDRSIGVWERNEKQPTLKSINSLAKALNVSPATLVEDRFIGQDINYNDPKEVVNQISALYMGGKMDENDLGIIYNAISEMYIDAKIKAGIAKSKNEE